jgi:hypothetical protein
MGFDLSSSLCPYHRDWKHGILLLDGGIGRRVNISEYIGHFYRTRDPRTLSFMHCPKLKYAVRLQEDFC